MRINRYLIKINRLSAWVLFALMIIFIITGYGWAFHVVMRPSEARNLHINLKDLLVFFFLVHVLISTKFTLKRWKIMNRLRVLNRWEAHHEKLVDISLLLIGLVAFSMVLSLSYGDSIASYSVAAMATVNQYWFYNATTL